MHNPRRGARFFLQKWNRNHTHDPWYAISAFHVCVTISNVMCSEGKDFFKFFFLGVFKILHKTKTYSEEVKCLNNLLTLSNFSSNIDFVLLFDSGYTGDYAIHSFLFRNLYMVASIDQDGCNCSQSSEHYYLYYPW